jgi:Rod binding domain-containing protein
MSVAGLSGLPQVSEAALPAAVRNGSAKDQEAYKAALGFEQVLLGQLVKSMASDGPLSEGPYAAPVQDALSSGLINNGGLGLATDLYRALTQRTSSAGTGKERA